MLGLQRLGRARDHRLGILDVLRFVQNDGAERKLLQRGEIATQQRVVGNNQIVLRNFLAQGVAMFTGGKQQDLLVRRELRRFLVPIEDHAGRANNEAGRPALLFAQMLQPRECLHRFAETHVVGQQRAELEPRRIGEKMQPRFLVRPQLRVEPLRLVDLGQTLEFGHCLAQLL